MTFVHVCIRTSVLWRGGGRRGPDGTRGYAYTHIHARARVRHTNARPSTVRERRGHGLRITQAGALFTCYYYRVVRKKNEYDFSRLAPRPSTAARSASCLPRGTTADIRTIRVRIFGQTFRLCNRRLYYRATTFASFIH